MSASDTASCSRCGGPLSPTGDCPRCLLELGLGGTPLAPPESFGEPAREATTGPPPEPPSLEEVRAAFADLEVEALLGRGGMGAVFRARQPRLDRQVALKVLPRAMGRQAGFAERFAREARALARLSHPGIVAVHDYGCVDGLSYLVMEYVDGVNLRQLLRAGSIAPARALAITRELCEALQFAHDEGVVHRDIKPENVLVDTRGRVKVADFGLAKLTGGPNESGLTRSDQVMGTPHYMAPEQFERPAEVDHRADLFALGVVLYEMLTGGLPRGHFEPPSQRVRVDVRLDEIVLKALEREPARRYQHALEIKTDVELLTPEAPGDRPRDEKQPAKVAHGASLARLTGKETGKALLAFLALWILLGAAWNHGPWTFAVAFLAMVAGTGWMLFERVRAEPSWYAPLAAEPRARRIGRGIAFLAGAALAFGAVVAGHTTWWERGVSTWSPHTPGSNGVADFWAHNPWAMLRLTTDPERFSLLFPAEVQPRVALTSSQASVATQPSGPQSWLLLLGGFTALAITAAGSVHRRENGPGERRRAWHAGGELASLALGALVLLWIGDPLGMHQVRSEVSLGLEARVPREQAVELLRDALARHGLEVDVKQELSVLEERNGSTLARATVLRAEQPSPWKRWRTSFGGVRRSSPQVWGTLISRQGGSTRIELRAGLYDPRRPEHEGARALLRELAAAMDADDATGAAQRGR